MSLLKEISSFKAVYKDFNFVELLGLSGTKQESLKTKAIKGIYEQPEALGDLLDLAIYSADSQLFIGNDAKTYSAVFEISQFSTNGKPLDYAIEKRDLVASAIRYLPQESNNPYILQTFSSEEPIDELIDEIEEYQKGFWKGDAYQAEYNRLWRNHLAAISNEEGYFVDPNTKARWRGHYRRTRIVIQRSFSKYDSDLYESEGEEINSAVEQFSQALASAGLLVRRYNPSDVYKWLVPWFSPRPEGCKDGYELVKKHPLPYKEGEDFSGLDEIVFKSRPFFDVENRCIEFSKGIYSSVVSVDHAIKNPKVGIFTDVGGDARSLSALQKLPSGCIVASTTVLTPTHETEKAININQERAKGDSARAETMRANIEESKLAIDRNHAMFPSAMQVYFRGSGLTEMKQNRQRIVQTLRTIGLDPVDLAGELSTLDVYLKFLPTSYKPIYDKFLYRTRLNWDAHIASLLPLYSSSIGTGNHGMVFSTSEGMPFTFDPLNPADKEQNSMMSVLAPPGSGKSATVNQLIAGAKASHNPYFVIIDVNGSFRLHHDYFKSFGLEAHYIEISDQGEVSLPLFAGAIQAYHIHKSKELGEEYEYFQETEDHLKDDSQSDDSLDSMVLTAKLMVTRGDANAEKQFLPQDYSMLGSAILMSAEAAVKEGRKMVITSDIVATLLKMSDDGAVFNTERKLRQERRDRAEDMAESLENYTKGVKGKLFNSDKESHPWPDCDFLVLDLKLLANEGYEDILYLTYMGLINRINALGEKRRGTGRNTVIINDEAHVVNMVKTIATFKRKNAKMWRKMGLWLWDVTQNIGDYPDEAFDILNVCEWLLLLKMPKNEIKILQEKRSMADEEVAMIESLVSEKGKYVEGVILSSKVRAKFRSIPPVRFFMLGQTEEHEYAERLQVANKMGITELEAMFHLEKEVEIKRCAN